MQKTKTVYGKKFSASQIIKETEKQGNQVSNGEDNMVKLNGIQFWWNYRKDEGYYCPVCEKEEADRIRIMEESTTGFARYTDLSL